MIGNLRFAIGDWRVQCAKARHSLMASHRGLVWLGILLLSGFCALAEHRFPPPEFEGGHQLPVTTTPPARQVLLEYLDVAVLGACLVVASVLVYKKRSRKGLIALSIFSVLYFGFWKKGCVCSIGSVQNVALALFDPGYAVPAGVLAFFVLPLAFALFAGRTFCAGVCPHGALQDLVLLGRGRDVRRDRQRVYHLPI